MGLINYFKETKNEMKHITWPTVQQAVTFTVVVILVSLFVALLLGLFQYLFSEFIIKNII
jgi:preprotein translocase subunit SecE